jgi:hypothetical protein
MRMWLEPMLSSIRFDPDHTDAPLVWDLDAEAHHPRIVLMRTDEAAARG